MVEPTERWVDWRQIVESDHPQCRVCGGPADHGALMDGFLLCERHDNRFKREEYKNDLLPEGWIIND